jgi:predicted AlkP superfamily phosphohydrolase/phosphomutase
MTEHRQGRVLIIALDAAELTLIEQLAQQGMLPNITRLRDASARGRIRSAADWFVAAPWPSFYTGTSPTEHGIYHYLPWNPRAMASQPLARDQFTLEPFWRDFQARGIETLVIDAPMVHPPPRQGHGTEICGWCTHDCLSEPWVYPASVRERIRADSHEPMKLVETQRPMSLEELGRLTDVLNASTRNIRDLSLSLLIGQPWDFALVSFTATHAGGHQLWGPTSLDPKVGGPGGDAIAAALESVYIECDRAVGSLIESVPDDTTIMLMSLHGMEANTCCGELLPEMLRLILSGQESDETVPFRLLSALRELVPRTWRHAVKHRLPQPLQDHLTGFWRTGGKDWPLTRAFALVPDLQGYVRINLRGREAEGVVEPGEEYDRLCSEIAAGLATFVDADTGQPIVEEVKRMDAIYPGHPKLDHLPDVAINWAKTPCAMHREIKSPFGSIPWPTPGLDFDGRSGNHHAYGFLMVSGASFAPGTTLPELDILDVAPTLYDIFDLPRPAHMHGQSFIARCPSRV